MLVAGERIRKMALLLQHLQVSCPVLPCPADDIMSGQLVIKHSSGQACSVVFTDPCSCYSIQYIYTVYMYSIHIQYLWIDSSEPPNLELHSPTHGSVNTTASAYPPRYSIK